jgi:hypothetical protein
VSTTHTENASNGASNGAANGQSAVSAAIAQLAQSKGITIAPEGGSEGTPESGAQPGEVAQRDVTPENGTPPPAKVEPAPGEAQGDAKQWADRYVAKDSQFQGERRARKEAEKRAADLERQHNELIEALRSDPVGVGRKHGARFGDIAAAKLLEGQQGKDKAQPGADEVPPWARQLVDDNKALRSKLETIEKERDDFRRAETTRARQQGIADMLKEQSEFTMLNELGKHDIVLKLVEQHYGDDSDVPDERELQETIYKYSREVERQLRADLDGLVKRPSIRELVAKELGGKSPASRKEAMPARPEIEGEADEGDGVPVIPNGQAQQRLSHAPPASWSKEEALRRTAAEMQSIFRGRSRED